jgi:cytochrome c oxidase assembly factor CtaG
VATGLLAGVPGPACQGPPALTAARVFTSWTLDLPLLLAVLLAGGLYLAGMRRVRVAGQPGPPARVAAFYLGGLGAAGRASTDVIGARRNNHQLHLQR